METDVQVLDADYRIDGNTPVVRLFCQDLQGRNLLGKVTDFRPYFYALPGDVEAARKEISGSEFSHEGEELEVREIEEVEKLDGNERITALKIYTDVPPDVPKLKSEVKELEAVEQVREFDIPFYKRFLIDRQISPVSWIRLEGEEEQPGRFDRAVKVESIAESSEKSDPGFERLAFDLEVYQEEIIMASFAGDNYRKLLCTEQIDRDYVENVEDEKQLIARFIEILEEIDVDILLGYNTDEFDFSKLRDRAQKHGLELSLGRNGERMKFKRRGRFSSARLKGRMHLDLYPFVAHILSPGLESETLELDSVAEELLGKNKDDMSWEEMKHSWKEKQDLEQFADYALKDSELAFELGEELVPQVLELSRLTGLIPFDACRLTYGQLTENFLLKEAHAREMLAPNRPTRSDRSSRERKGSYTGGFVYSPDPGLYDEIVLLDFRSLYPTVMVSHNISPDTLNLEDCEERFELEQFDYDFCQDEQGFFPDLIESLVEERAQIKQEMDQGGGSRDSRQRALKILANSFYGYLGYSGARWYSRECAEATTSLGREYIQKAIDKAEHEGFEVVYGDTDSLFLRGDDIDERIDSFLNQVNSDLPEFMELELEGYFQRGFFTSTDSGEGAKKKYALMDQEGSLKITGFEYVRRDWSPLAKETQKNVLELVLQDRIEEAAEVVKETIEDLRNGETPVEKLKIYTTLTKPPEEYESTAPHVEAVKKARQRGDSIEPETTVEYVITRGQGSISSRAELAKYADSYDADYYIENQIVPVAARVLKVFGYTREQLRGKGKQSGLGEFG